MTYDNRIDLSESRRPTASSEAAGFTGDLQYRQADGSAQQGCHAMAGTMPTTLAEALAFVRQHDRLSDNGLREAVAAVQMLEKVTARSADQLPAAPKDLTRVIECACPGRYKIKPKNWSNRVSSIRALLWACGRHAPLTRGQPLSDPLWEALIGALTNSEDRFRMLGFARYCCACCISPNDVTEQTLDGYIQYRRTWTIRTHLGHLLASIRLGWNRAVRSQLPGWPSRLLTVPPNPNVESLPLCSFPLPLQDEIRACVARHTQPDAFDGDFALWRPATAASARICLIRAASVTARRLGGPERVTSLAVVVTAESFEFFLRHIFKRSGNVWRDMAGHYATILLGVARDFVKVDGVTLAQLEKLRGVISERLRERRKPGLSEGVSRKIMPFEDPRVLQRLFALPADLYREAASEIKDRRVPRLVRGAQKNEQGLMLDLLELDPMRRLTLAGINFETDFIRDERGRITKLWISGDRMKNGIAVKTPIPADLDKRIRTHWAVYRPNLPGSNSPWLFPGRKGGPRTPGSVTATLSKLVTRRLGLPFHPHMMRHILATQLYNLDANNGVVVQKMLRHSTIQVTEHMYGTMSNAGANAAWQKEVQRFRSGRTGAKRRGNRGVRKNVTGRTPDSFRPSPEL
jgi:integrase